MDVPLLKQFALWRGKKRFVVGEEDLQTNKISSVVKGEGKGKRQACTDFSFGL